MPVRPPRTCLASGHTFLVTFLLIPALAGPWLASAVSASATGGGDIVAAREESGNESASSSEASATVLFRQMNEARLGRGLGALQRDSSLDDLARQHAADMSRRGYFSHTTPEGQSPFDRVGTQSGAFLVGEMLARVPGPEQAYGLFMASPAHRENILYPEFGRVGIGLLELARSQVLAAVIFTN